MFCHIPVPALYFRYLKFNPLVFIAYNGCYYSLLKYSLVEQV